MTTPGQVVDQPSEMGAILCRILEGVPADVGEQLATSLGVDCAYIKPMHDDPRVLSVFKIFEVRAGAELERLHLETVLKENEERLKDLFDERRSRMSTRESIPSCSASTARL